MSRCVPALLSCLFLLGCGEPRATDTPARTATRGSAAAAISAAAPPREDRFPIEREALESRRLRAILEEVLLNVMYDLPSRDDVAKCVVDETVVREKSNPTLVPRKAKSSRSERPSRAAS